MGPHEAPHGDATTPVETNATHHSLSPERLLKGVLSPERLLKAVERFDLSHNPPTSDKASHVSNQAEKAALRQILRADPKVERLLAQLRQLLEYEPPPAGASPPDLRVLSAEIDALAADWWNRDLNASLPGAAELRGLAAGVAHAPPPRLEQGRRANGHRRRWR